MKYQINVVVQHWCGGLVRIISLKWCLNVALDCRIGAWCQIETTYWCGITLEEKRWGGMILEESLVVVAYFSHMLHQLPVEVHRRAVKV